jgi:hypothetical protein
MRHHITVLDLATIRELLDGDAGVRRVFDGGSGILMAFYRQKMKTPKGAHADGAATAASKAARRVGMAAAQ